MTAAFFDRLTDSEPIGLKESVQNELVRIFSTRVYTGDLEVRSVLNFGLPSIVHVGRNDGSHYEKMKALIKETIESFEPRLRNTKVENMQLSDSNEELWVTIRTQLAGGEQEESFQFPLAAVSYKE